MKTRVILFEGGGFGVGLSPTKTDTDVVLDPVRFFIPDSHGFEAKLGAVSIAQLVESLGAQRHETFDYAVGNMGSQCTLLNLPKSDLQKITFQIGAEVWAGQWLTFPFAVRALIDGQCRRYLQLAVQYISSGGIDENVVAAHADAGFLKTMEDALKTTPVN